MKTYTVQCGYAAYWANTVTVSADSFEEALTAAIVKANDDAAWRSIDHCGDTFIDAVAEGEDADPWGSDTLSVPDAYTEAALHVPVMHDEAANRSPGPDVQSPDSAPGD